MRILIKFRRISYSRLVARVSPRYWNPSAQQWHGLVLDLDWELETRMCGDENWIEGGRRIDGNESGAATAQKESVKPLLVRALQKLLTYVRLSTRRRRLYTVNTESNGRECAKRTVALRARGCNCRKKGLSKRKDYIGRLCLPLPATLFCPSSMDKCVSLHFRRALNPGAGIVCVLRES